MALPAILFDLDGTLVDSAMDIAQALSTLRAQRGGGPMPAAAVRPLVSRGADVLVVTALGALAQDPKTDLAAFRTILLEQPVNPDIVFSNVRTALQVLSGRGHAMAVVTNKPEGLAKALLAGLGLDRHFGAVIGGDSCRAPKPDPAPILKALELIDARPTDAILIGDSAVDAQAAAGCAIPFILYEGGYDADGCAAYDVHARFINFAALADIVASFRRGEERAVS